MKKESTPKPSLRSLDKGFQTLNEKVDATRSELQATRTELNNRIGFLSSEMGQLDSRVAHIEKTMATKEDISRLALAIQANQSDVTEIKSDMVTKQDFHKLLTVFDGFAKDRKQLFDNDEIQRAYLRDHEKRISHLESHEKNRPD